MKAEHFEKLLAIFLPTVSPIAERIDTRKGAICQFCRLLGEIRLNHSVATGGIRWVRRIRHTADQKKQNTEGD